MRVRPLSTPFLLPLLLLVLLLPSLRLAAVSVYLHRTARVGQEVVVLADVATVVASEPQTAERLGRLPLWRASGNPGLVPAELIKRRLAAVIDGQLVVVGAYTAIIPRKAAEGVELEFYTELLDAVAALPGKAVGRIEVELLSGPELPAQGELRPDSDSAGITLALKGIGARRGPSDPYVAGLFQATYSLSGQGVEWAAQRGVGVRIRQFLPVAVAARDLPAGSVLDWEDLELREEDVEALPGGFLAPEDRPEIFRTASPVRRGERHGHRGFPWPRPMGQSTRPGVQLRCRRGQRRGPSPGHFPAFFGAGLLFRGGDR
jgi:hypothetical protein